MDNKESVKIIGIKKAPSSKNPEVVYHTYYFVSQYSDYDIEHAEVYGTPCGSDFTRTDIGCKVGDVVELYYKKGYQDKAELCGCKVLQAATPAK